MDYVTCLRKYEKYKWYKPILEIVIVEIGAALATILCVCLSTLIGYEIDFEGYTKSRIIEEE